MTYEVLPKVELGQLQDAGGRAACRPTPADEEVETRIRQIAESAATSRPKDGAADSGDRVTISYVGKIDGEPFKGGSDENGVLVLGSGRFIPGFEEQLEGVKVGDEKTINVTFPENYSAQAACRQGRDLRCRGQGGCCRAADCHRRRTWPSGSASPRWRSFATYLRKQIEVAEHARPRARRSSARFSTSSTRCTASSCRRKWSSRSSTSSGGRSPAR